MKRPAGFAHRFIQYGGNLAMASVTLGELYAGAYKLPHPTRLLAGIADLLRDVTVINFDAACAEEFGKVRGRLLRVGIRVATADLMIAAVALVHNLTLVTHNTADYQHVPGLRLDDWLVP
jgi:tRNA(fMet)-specific endonuclease VapC